MNDITIFNHLGNNIRVITDNQGEPLFVLNDICDALGITNTRNVAGRLDGDCVRQADVTDNLGRSRQTNVVNEAGLYEVIIRSDKPEAAQFRRWVTSEVLPSIRKRGGYLTPEAVKQALRDPDFIIQLATDLKEERAKRAQLEAQAEANAPKVLFADAVASAKTATSSDRKARRGTCPLKKLWTWGYSG